MRAFVLLVSALAVQAAQGAVTVTYGNPDRFTDAGDRSNDPVKIAQALADHLRRLGESLPQGTDVRIEILDVDRAGRPRLNLPTETRIMNGKSDPPCIELRYEVVTRGSASAAQRERVCDTDYLRRLPAHYSEHDPLVYEKRMLDEWFRARFGDVPRSPR
ncbi:MAG: DUF3016 domain-containing protein [Bacillota bacterium]